MQFRKLGYTEIDVSVICLGTMTWGQQNSEADAHQQLDMAIAANVNFIDTAEMYPVPPMEQTYTRTEQYIGSWLRQRGNRHKIILASKIAGRAEWLPYIRDGKNCFNRKNIEAALNASLKRLNTDYIDLYQLHWPDRHTNIFGQRDFDYNPTDKPVPVEETLQIMADIIETGKVRHFGLSNETPWGAMTFIKHAEQLSLPKPVSIQNAYNLLNRDFESGLSEISHYESIGLLAYSPLGFGVLSGKYLNGVHPQDTRLTLFERFNRYSSDIGQRATQAYVDIARRHGLDPAQMALAYVNSRPFVTSNIIGATSLEQLSTNIASIKIELSQEILDDIESVQQSIPNPCP